MNAELFSILQSPDDGTAIKQDLISEGGIKYKKTKSGILMLDPSSRSHSTSNAVYSSPMFRKWNAVVDERIRYYTKKQSLAGLLANLSYRSVNYFNRRPKGEWLLDIGCGDGAHVRFLKDRSTYIGLDRNVERLEILKHNYPEVTAIYGDADSLPFKAGMVKHIFSSNAFEHIWYLKDAVMELYRVIDTSGRLIIIIPTEGGLWNVGRTILSKPHFRRKYPYIDFDFISHVEHCNEAYQVMRTLDTFFYVKKKYIPTRIPTIYLNALIEFHCNCRSNLVLENVRRL